MNSDVRILICALSLTFSCASIATPLPESKKEYCTRFSARSEDLQTIQDFSLEPTNLMAFKNHGGLFNGGTCWWHSRFQRNIFYLSIFNPTKDKPSTLEIRNIIHKMRQGSEVITISGYVNFEEFSNENKELIQRELDDWQIYDGLVLGGWIDGLSGNTKVRPKILKKMMDEVFEYVAIKKKIAYEKLQIKGIMSHAWLVVGIKKC